jgi:hypothetical protein
MTNYTPSRLGQANAAGDALALFLKVAMPEVLTAFDERQVMKERHLIRTIEHGKSAQFPATWKATAAYHTPGNELTGSNLIKHNERVINIDSLLVADTFIANIDEAMNHYDVRSIYTHQLGEALAYSFDTTVLQVGVLAARASATISGGNGGTALTNAGYANDGEVLASGLFAAAQALDEKDVPESERFAIFKPAQYYLLAQSTKVINKDWGGAGAFADGKVLRVAGVEVVKSNHLPTTNIASNPSGANNTYNGDFSNTRGLVMNKMAVGTVKLLDLAMEGKYQVERQGTLLVAKYAMGHGILRPECAVELKIA